MKTTLLIFLMLVPAGPEPPAWGFYAHSLINRLAVYSLPPEMTGFFKKHIEYITEKAVNPDRRRYAMAGEAERHFIDLDNYPDSLKTVLPRLSWEEAVKQLGEDALRASGIVPWQVQKMKYQLTEAFRLRQSDRILQTATDLGHYIADANVPLHTTKNYNGQLTGQHGIHGFWESRLPELFSTDYDLLIGKAAYEKNVRERSWQAVLQAHAALDSVLEFERRLTRETPPDRKFSIEERNGITVRSYSRGFSAKYHRMLEDQVERQMKRSVRMIADLWYTAWVDAGQPDLDTVPKFVPDPEEEKEMMKGWLQRILNVRKEADY
ncbi:zinc dependent phospholipase C family protein [Leadbetterella sp. DM7]|uniref:zinc dependent phospholipase C family protein n=1 Tax=Leadbetterella sp. DM7 TaxID=3235085 RepID=UPI00349EBAD4